MGGTSVGGGTFWGLGTLISQSDSFDCLLELAAQGDHRNVSLAWLLLELLLGCIAPFMYKPFFLSRR